MAAVGTNSNLQVYVQHSVFQQATPILLDQSKLQLNSLKRRRHLRSLHASIVKSILLRVLDYDKQNKQRLVPAVKESGHPG